MNGRKKRAWTWIGAAGALGCLVSLAVAIDLFQVDTFQDGTLMNWSGGAQRINQPNGGPQGAGDRFLQLTGDGSFGPGGVPAMFNGFQWAGNYQSAGVKVIEADVKNFSNNAVHLRIVLFGPGGTRWTSTNAYILPPNSPWLRGSWYLSESEMTRVLGTSSYATTMASVVQMMFRHDPGAPDPGGTPLAATIGFDNIRALDAATVRPESFLIQPGVHLSGNLTSLWFSDQDYLHAKINILAEETGYPIQVNFDMTSPIQSASKIEFILRARASQEGNGQYVELFNWVHTRWDRLVDVFATTFDSTATGSVKGNASEYIQAGTRAIRGRLGWEELISETAAVWEVHIDQAVAKITP